MSRARSAPRTYLWIWGAALILLGVGSLVVHPHFGVGGGVTSNRLFGIETNGWHGVAGTTAGVVALASAWSRRSVRQVALGTALLAGVIPAAVFLVSGDGSTALGLIPVDTTDALTLHLLPGLAGLASVALDRPEPA